MNSSRASSECVREKKNINNSLVTVHDHHLNALTYIISMELSYNQMQVLREYSIILLKQGWKRGRRRNKRRNFHFYLSYI